MRRTTPDTFPALLGDDLYALATREGGELRAVTTLTALQSTVLARASFLLEFADGSRLKGRRLDSDAHAKKIADILPLLPVSHAPAVVARHGTALLMEWIAGQTPNAERFDAAFVRRIGAFQGELHNTPIPAALRSAYTPRAASWLDVLAGRLDELVACRALSVQDAAAARRLVLAAPPPMEPMALCHCDLHGDNIVLRDTDERLYVIDNESVGIHSPYFDILRTWHLWPLRGPLWSAYLAGYRTSSDLADISPHTTFWGLFVLADSALVRIAANGQGADRALDKLKRLLVDPAAEFR